MNILKKINRSRIISSQNKKKESILFQQSRAVSLVASSSPPFSAPLRTGPLYFTVLVTDGVPFCYQSS